MSFLSLIATLGINTTPFQQGLDKARIHTQRWGNDIAGELKGKLAGAFAGAAVLEGIRRVVEYAGHIEDLHDITGVARSSLQAFDLAAKNGGASVEDIAHALKKIRLAQGNKQMVDDFKNLGFTLHEIHALSPEQIFLRIADKVKEGTLSARDFTSAIQIMGKTADGIFPAMQQGMGDTVKLFQQLNLAMDDDTVRRLDTFGDSLGLAGVSLKKLGALTLDGPLAAVEELLSAVKLLGINGKAAFSKEDQFEPWLDAIKKLINNHPYLHNPLFSPFAGLIPHIETSEDRAGVTHGMQDQLKQTQDRVFDEGKARNDAKRDRDAKDQQERLQWMERIKAVQFGMMTNDQKVAYLNKQIVESQQKYWEATKGSADETEAQYEILSAQAQIRDLQKVGPLRADSLASIGGYVGGAASISPMLDIGRQQLNGIKQIVANTNKDGSTKLYFGD